MLTHVVEGAKIKDINKSITFTTYLSSKEWYFAINS